MHELGIIIHLNKTLHTIAKENKLEEIGAVTLEIGEVSAIIPHYLSDCWEYYRKKFPLIEKAELKIEILPATTYCEDCKQTYATLPHGKQCPCCKSEHTYLIAGDECNIKEIEAQ
ncbi:MAG: hydrogenase maturation nickel metallochaperone HypA [Longicatena sp.]